ncbi:MAG: flagellar biosynthetic protein FliO [Thalassolituus sp.]|uniref:flagellar biosynthetic protein FliO n=1 Tax=Thalassolituus sp. TaxID=2030822 RepID=UPI00398296C0
MNVFSACAKTLLIAFFMLLTFSLNAEESTAIVDENSAELPSTVGNNEQLTTQKPAETVKTQPMLAVNPMASAGKVALFLVVIVGLILLLAWLVNKTKAGQFSQSNSQIRLLATLPLGLKEKIAVIEVGDQQIVVGITPQQITTLATLTEKLDTTTTNSSKNFADVLKMAIRK